MQTTIFTLALLLTTTLFANDEIFQRAQDVCGKIALERVEKILDKNHSHQEQRIVDSQIDVSSFDISDNKDQIQVDAQIFTYIVDQEGRELNGQYSFPGSYNQRTDTCQLAKKAEFHDWWCEGGMLSFLSSVQCIK